MENTYGIEELIGMLEDLMHKAPRLPMVGKSAIDINKMNDIVTDMRMSLPMEIKQAQQVVFEKNSIIADAKREAEQIIRIAEQKRKEILNESDIIKEAHRRANEFINNEQNKCAQIRMETDSYLDRMLKQIEELMLVDINDIRKLRSAIGGVPQQGGITVNPIQPVEMPGGQK